MSPLMATVTALGWIGAVAAIFAYAMVTRGRWRADSVAFQVTNLAAAGAMLVVAAANGVWPSAAANTAWLVIGTAALLPLVRGRSARRVPRPGGAPEAAADSPV